MAGTTLAEAKTILASLETTYKTSINPVESYTISTTGGERSLKRRALSELREEIAYWNAEVKKLTRGGITIRGATPVG